MPISRNNDPAWVAHDNVVKYLNLYQLAGADEIAPQLRLGQYFRTALSNVNPASANRDRLSIISS